METKIHKIKVYTSEVFCVALDAYWILTFQFLDNIKFSNVALNICKENWKCSVNFTYLNLYFMQKFVQIKKNFEIDTNISFRTNRNYRLTQLV